MGVMLIVNQIENVSKACLDGQGESRLRNVKDAPEMHRWRGPVKAGTRFVVHERSGRTWERQRTGPAEAAGKIP